jgi:aryl-alcohol dehydrogenase-like predicted oxidoreductase
MIDKINNFLDATKHTSITRRQLLTFLSIAAASTILPLACSKEPALEERIIKNTGEKIPIVGLGTYQSFNVGNDQVEIANIINVLQTFVSLGGRLVDTAPSYGASESVLGRAMNLAGLRDDLFIATKLGLSSKPDGSDVRAVVEKIKGKEQTDQSFRVLGVNKIDLIQVHNLSSCGIHLQTLRELKAKNKIRYIGITHANTHYFPDIEKLVSENLCDFVQLNYSVAVTEAQNRLLPFLLERGVPVIVNSAFHGGYLFKKVKGVSLPAFAQDFGIKSWSQFFLKFVLAHPAVTCVIPATRNIEHLRDNMRAGIQPFPDSKTCAKLVEFIKGI